MRINQLKTATVQNTERTERALRVRTDVRAGRGTRGDYIYAGFNFNVYLGEYSR